MAQANDQQMQEFADRRIRRRAEMVRKLIVLMQDDRAAMDAVYDRAANGEPWSDARTDGPPKLLTHNDHLNYNTFAHDIIAAITGHANYSVFMSACVQPPEIT